jgi:hypothetical protein
MFSKNNEAMRETIRRAKNKKKGMWDCKKSGCKGKIVDCSPKFIMASKSMAITKKCNKCNQLHYSDGTIHRTEDFTSG